MAKLLSGIISSAICLLLCGAEGGDVAGLNTAGWDKWTARPDASLYFSIEEDAGGGGLAGLVIENRDEFPARGAWWQVAHGIEAGQYYEVRAALNYVGGPVPLNYEVFCALTWLDNEGNRLTNQKSYPVRREDGEQRLSFSGHYWAPEKAVSAKLELYLNERTYIRVIWTEADIRKVSPPEGRPIRVGTLKVRPSGNASVAASVEEIIPHIEKAGQAGVDILCLGEWVNFIGVVSEDGSYPAYYEIAEPIPGPTTDRLGEVAKTHDMMLVASLGEKDAGKIYNTAVLIGGDGKVIGKYRKVYVPEGEMDQGVLSGSSYPVFKTRLGTIGIMVCWDSHFPEPARSLAMQGADFIFVPIWGGNSTLLKARAIENHSYVITSGYDIASQVIDIWGEVMLNLEENGTFGFVDIDLSRPPDCPWEWPLGNHREVFMQSLRHDVGVNP